MAYDKILRVQWLASWAQRQGEATGKTPVQVLQAIQDAIAANDIANGKILISTTEGGGTVQFQIPRDHSPLEIGDLAQREINYLSGKREIKRLRVSFRRTLP